MRMSNWNPIEHQLRSWKPRGPSGRLRDRLFPANDQAIIESPSAFGGRWAWLAPVMGCFLAMMVVSGSRNSQLGVISAAPTNWLAAVASNQSYAAYIAAGFHSEQNSLQQDPIEWTNGTRAVDRLTPVPLAKTNSLIQ